MNTVRCAIYTRKSTDEGLEQDFNSLHAQREAGGPSLLTPPTAVFAVYTSPSPTLAPVYT